MAISAKLTQMLASLNGYGNKLNTGMNGIKAGMDLAVPVSGYTPFFSVSDTPYSVKYGPLGEKCDFVSSDEDLTAWQTDPKGAGQIIDLRNNMLWRRVSGSWTSVGTYTATADFYRGRFYRGNNGTKSYYYLLNGTLVPLIP